jgi:hypothetical protein
MWLPTAVWAARSRQSHAESGDERERARDRQDDQGVAGGLRGDPAGAGHQFTGWLQEIVSVPRGVTGSLMLSPRLRTSSGCRAGQRARAGVGRLSEAVQVVREPAFGASSQLERSPVNGSDLPACQATVQSFGGACRSYLITPRRSVFTVGLRGVKRVITRSSVTRPG